MTKLQYLCLKALEEMTLVELNDKYFDGGGLGYTKRVIAGSANPHLLMMETMCKKFDEKYQRAYKEQEELAKSMSRGW